jgi:DHA2 family methylenomycin A resistance protein-like MFS transporter
MAVFVVASGACGLAPDLGALVGARLVQGAGAAMMMPSALTLIREAYPDQVRRGRAIALWTIVGSVAAAAGPVTSGALNLVSWRTIFFINLPAGAVALILLARAARSPRRQAPFDWAGQIAAVLAMGGLTRSAAGQRPRTPHRGGQRRVQHQPPARRRPGRGRLRRPARQPGETSCTACARAW